MHVVLCLHKQGRSAKTEATLSNDMPLPPAKHPTNPTRTQAKKGPTTPWRERSKPLHHFRARLGKKRPEKRIPNPWKERCHLSKCPQTLHLQQLQRQNVYFQAQIYEIKLQCISMLSLPSMPIYLVEMKSTT